MQRIRELRTAQGLTREQLAVKAGLAARTVARAEHDEFVNGRTMAKLAVALGVEVVDLYRTAS